MSKNITIQEGGVGKQLTVDKLKTNIVGGGTCLWVPEDERRLGTKYISKNGTYRASADGYYGYSEVTVSGVGTATGKDPDGSGDDAVAYADPDTGEIVVDKIPSSIEVITPPTNPYGTYMDGQTISKDGMVVKAYLASGGEYGTVPIDEITIQPTTAVYDESTDIQGGTEITSDMDLSPFPNTFISVRRIGGTGGQNDSYWFVESLTSDYVFIPFTGQDSIKRFIMAWKHNGVGFRRTTKHPSDSSETITTEVLNNGSSSEIYIRNDESAYVRVATIDNFGWGTNNSVPDFGYTAPTPSAVGAESLYKKIGWEALYGTQEQVRAGSRQTITVSWPRPGDGKVLETTFEILVAPPIYGDSEN